MLLPTTVTTNDMKNGIFGETDAAYLADGSVVAFEGAGTTQPSGTNKWRALGNGVTSDGHVVNVDGEMELANHRYKGKVYEG